MQDFWYLPYNYSVETADLKVSCTLGMIGSVWHSRPFNFHVFITVVYTVGAHICRDHPDSVAMDLGPLCRHAPKL